MGKATAFSWYAGVDVDPGHVVFLKEAFTLGGLDGFLQEFLNALGANALAPPDQGAGVEGELVLEVFETTKILPVGISQEAFHHGFVAFVEGVLEVMEADDQAYGQAGAALLGDEEGSEFLFEEAPVDLVGEDEQGVFGVEDLVQPGLEEVFLITSGWLFWLHESPVFDCYYNTTW